MNNFGLYILQGIVVMLIIIILAVYQNIKSYEQKDEIDEDVKKITDDLERRLKIAVEKQRMINNKKIK